MIFTNTTVKPSEVAKLVADYNYKMTNLAGADPASTASSSYIKEPKGIRLKAEESFVLYGVNKDSFTTDGFMALPLEASGTNYFAVCHNPAVYR